MKRGQIWFCYSIEGKLYCSECSKDCRWMLNIMLIVCLTGCRSMMRQSTNENRWMEFTSDPLSHVSRSWGTFTRNYSIQTTTTGFHRNQLPTLLDTRRCDSDNDLFSAIFISPCGGLHVTCAGAIRFTTGGNMVYKIKEGLDRAGMCMSIFDENSGW